MTDKARLLLHHRRVQHIFEHHPRVAAGGGSGGHDDADRTLFRVDGEAVASGACPHRVTGAAGGNTEAVLSAHGKSETEAIAGNPCWRSASRRCPANGRTT